MTPITRLEVFLNGIINGGEVPEPITRIEVMLNDIKNGDVVTLTPITRGECYLARISGANVQIPEPVTRVEMYLAKKCGVDIVTPTPIVRIEHWLNAWASGEDPLVTLTGKIISFFSKAAKPFKSTKINIDPVQDLHGYDSPWPGGGGVNKLPPGDVFDTTINDIRFTSDGKGNYTIKGTATAQAFYNFSIAEVVLPSTVFVHLLNNVGTYNASLAFFNGNTQVDFTSTSPASKVIDKTTELGGKTINGMRLFVSSGAEVDITLSPMLCVDNAARSFAPYSNECPISGWTGATVYDTGTNIWDEDWELGGIDGNGNNTVSTTKIRSKNYIPVKPNTTYYFKQSSGCDIAYYRFDKSCIGRMAQAADATFTTQNDCCYVRFALYSGYGTTYNNDISINYPSTDHDYHAFSGSSVSLTFGSTVYGGTATDNGDGSWTVVATEASFDIGDFDFSIYSDPNRHIFRTAYVGEIDPALPSSTTTAWDAICEAFVSKSWNAIGASDNGKFSISPKSSDRLVFIDHRFSTVADFVAANSSVKVVYTLAEPITFTVSGDTLSSLLGVNNVWADTNEDTTIEVYGTPIT